MKAHHLTAKTNPVAEAHPIYKEAYNFARELNKLTEGKDLNDGERHTLFVNAEKAMTAAGGNRTWAGKAGEMASAVGAKIKGLAQALQDTTPVKGVDSMFDDLKQKASLSMGKSTQGSTVLRALDQYKQIVQRHPNTSKFFWGVAGVLTGLLTGGAGPVVALGAIKMIDSMVQGNQLSTSVGSGLKTAGTAMGAKALAAAGKAVANTDIPDIHNPFDPKPPVVDPNVVDPNVIPPKPVDPNVIPPKPVDPNVVQPPNPENIGGAVNYTVTKADAARGLSGIAKAHGSTVPEIAKLNPDIANVHNLQPGQVIKIIPHGATNPYGSPDTGFLGLNRTPAQSINPAHESFKFKAGRGILEGIQLITLPTTMMVDKQSTVQKWALNESLGRKRNSVQLTENGIMTLFMNLQRIDEAVRARPANGNDAAAQAKNGNPANTSSTAGPVGQLPGGNVGGLATGQAPAGNTMPYLAADPEGKFDTNYKGGISSKLSRGIETGLGRAGNWIKDKWKDSTTKVTANGLKRHWADAGSPTDSDQVAAVLQRLKVPDDVIKQLYQQLNFPAPALPQANEPATAQQQAGGGTSQAQQQAGDTNQAQGQSYDTDASGNVRTFANGMPSMSQTVGNADATAGGAEDMGGQGGRSVLDRLMGGGQQGGGQGSSAGDGRISQATNTILPQLARMTGPANADDLITIIDTALSVLQRSAPTAYREKMAQFRGQSAGRQRERAQDTIDRVRDQRQGGNNSQPAERNPLGPRGVVEPTGDAPQRADAPVRVNRDMSSARAMNMGESRKRTYGGKYVKESADQKLARQFENFLLKQE